MFRQFSSSDPGGNVINLTNHSFSRDTFKLLNKNLNFIPTPDVYNEQKRDKELQNFYRLIKLKGYFKNTENQQPNDENQIFKAKTKEKWTPAENHHSIETFINLVEKDINDSKNEPKKTKAIRKALKQLEKRQDIIISNDDKGGAVVIMDTDKYIEESDRQLSDRTNYKKLQNDPTLQHNKLVNDTITRFIKEKLLPQNIADGLSTSNPRTPKFYLSPKIHKPNNPGHPVISSVDCHTSNILRYVDYHLQPIVKNIPSYIKDTNDFIKKTKDLKVPKDAILVSLDVKGLYTSIPNSEGIANVKRAYYKYQQKTVPTKVLTTFLALILTLNNFIFDSKLYLQIKGCAVSTICVPAYANIFMAYFEEKFIYPLIDVKTLLYLRFTYDIFMIWTKPEKDLIEFLNELKTKHTSIKFEFKYSRNRV